MLVACLGNVIEWFDFALYTGFATVLAAVLTPGGWDGLLTVFGVFAVSLLFRPIGSMMAGLRADRVGRRPVLVGTIVLMTMATVGIAVLPPWAVIGVAAPAGLLTLRALQAFAAGGEISVAVSYLAEVSPTGQRGRYGQWYISTLAVGFAAGIGVSALITALLTPAELQAWGWRLAFGLALPLGAVALYLRGRLAESPLFRVPQRRVDPLSVLRGHWPVIRRCLPVVGANSATFTLWFLFLPSYLVTTGVASLQASLTCALTGLVAAAVTAPLFGKISDTVGRRPVLVAATSALAVICVPGYLWVRGGSTVSMVVVSIAIGIALGAFVLPAFLAEQLPTHVRATGIGLAYGVGSAVIGGTAPVIALALARDAPAVAVPLYLVVWAVAAAVAVIRSPETAPGRTRTAV